MTVLTANVTASDVELPTDTADPEPGSLWTLGDEVIEVGGSASAGTDQFGRRLPGVGFGKTRWLVQRGFAGTTPASHLSGATLTRYYPDAPGGTGGGSVTVDNQTDPPTSVMTIVAPGATIAGDEATLADAFPPDPWTVAETGTLTIQPTTTNADALVLKDEAGVTIARFTQTAPFPNPPPFFVSSGGDCGFVLPETGGGFAVFGPDGGALNVTFDGSTSISLAPNANPVVISAPSENAPFHLLRINDATGATIFAVASDGSVHIKTGTSIVADL